MGDNCFETDGAEDSDAQPVTTARIRNVTVVGQPIHGDHGTAWRDNARVNYSNCIWMDLGEDLVKFDNVDGDGAQGYGYNGTLSWANTWTTSYAAWAGSPAAQVNLCGANLYNLYGQYLCGSTGDMLAAITDSVFYNNNFASAYNEATARGVLAAATCNVVEPAAMPIAELLRGGTVVRGGKQMKPVIFINPCGVNDAVTSYNRSPACNCKDSEYGPCVQPAPFRGGFSPYYNWLEGWTAVDAYGMTDTAMNTPSDATVISIPDDGDLDNDMDVDLNDFVLFADTWLTRG